MQKQYAESVDLFSLLLLLFHSLPLVSRWLKQGNNSGLSYSMIRTLLKQDLEDKSYGCDAMVQSIYHAKYIV